MIKSGSTFNGKLEKNWQPVFYSFIPPSSVQNVDMLHTSAITQGKGGEDTSESLWRLKMQFTMQSDLELSLTSNSNRDVVTWRTELEM